MASTMDPPRPQMSVVSALTVMTTATDVLSVRSAAAGGFAGAGFGRLAGHHVVTPPARTKGDLRQFTAWLAGRGIDRAAVTLWETTRWFGPTSSRRGPPDMGRLCLTSRVHNYLRGAFVHGLRFTPGQIGLRRLRVAGSIQGCPGRRGVRRRAATADRAPNWREPGASRLAAGRLGGWIEAPHELSARSAAAQVGTANPHLS